MTGKRKKPTARTATKGRAATTVSEEAVVPTGGERPDEAPMPAVTEATEPPERGMSEVDRFLIDMAGQIETAQTEGATEDAAPAELVFPEIDPLATFWTEFDLYCKRCSITHYVAFCTMLNAGESPQLAEQARRHQFNYKRCPLCHTIEYVEHPWTYYDPARKLLVQVRPEWEWHAGGGEEWYAARLEDLFDKWSEYDVQIDVVFGPPQLIERYLQGEEA